MEKVGVFLNTTCLLVHIYASIKYYQHIFQITYSSIWLRNSFGEVTRKQAQQKLSLLYVKHLLVVTNASAKYYQNMSKGIKVIERTNFSGGNNITKKKVKVVSLARGTPTGPPLHLYQILTGYLKQYGELWPAQDFGFRGDYYIMKKMRVVSLAH